MNHIVELNKILQISQVQKKSLILLITGSSGCGKTFLTKKLAEQLDSRLASIFYFDSVGVPSSEEMINQFGSVEKWQEQMTFNWTKKLCEIKDRALVILEGQFHPRFAISACQQMKITNYELLVISCRPEVWTKRLIELRGQEELVTNDMRNWAELLKKETLRLGGKVIDTSESNWQRNLEEIGGIIHSSIK